MSAVSFWIQAFRGYEHLFTHPVLYVALVLIGYFYYRQNEWERLIFGFKITSWRRKMTLTVIYGCCAGVIGTLLTTVLGVTLTAWDIGMAWGLMLILTLVRIRYFCLSYAVGVMVILSWLARLLPIEGSSEMWAGSVLFHIQHLHIFDLLLLVVVLQFIEAFLIYIQAGSEPTPVYVEGRRGKLVGGFVMQSFWIIPLSVFTSSPAVPTIAAVPPHWWPLVPGVAYVVHTALGALPLPAVVSYSGLSLATAPPEKMRKMAKRLFLYSSVLLVLVVLGNYRQPFLLGAAVLSLFAHEWLVLHQQKVEQEGNLLFTNAGPGLQVLAILRGSTSDLLGLRPGESILRANGCSISTSDDLHRAMNSAPTYAKLEIRGVDGEIRLAQHSVFEGDRYLLGCVMTPDDMSVKYLDLGDAGCLRELFNRGRKVLHEKLNTGV